MEWHARVFRYFAHGSEGARLVELDGVLALVTPATPERSVLNSVLYTDPRRLERALDELTDLYAGTGIEAWTVWVHPDDRDAAARLEERGHKLDATPAAMGRELLGVEPHMPAGAEWTREADLAEVLRVNDEAYGWARTRPWTRALAELRPGGANVYLARLDGAPACTPAHLRPRRRLHGVARSGARASARPRARLRAPRAGAG